MIAWIDLETTGLDPRSRTVVEVGCIVTDDGLSEYARFSAVTDACYWAEMDEAASEMHRRSGLDTLSSRDGEDGSVIDIRFAAFLGRFTSAENRPVLAGSSVHFDREFMRYHLPRSLSCLHYRNLDVSTLTETARRFWPAVYDGRPELKPEDRPHRAIDDLEATLKLFRYYLGALGPRL